MWKVERFSHALFSWDLVFFCSFVTIFSYRPKSQFVVWFFGGKNGRCSLKSYLACISYIVLDRIPRKIRKEESFEELYRTMRDLLRSQNAYPNSNFLLPFRNKINNERIVRIMRILFESTDFMLTSRITHVFHRSFVFPRLVNTTRIITRAEI